ncbi:sensor domain-containing phosphodiesterase [Thermodesulfobacterium hydrogeniphilum]|uniref:sensor domain-containing phosphodiesterase n=1 Tax=Thermodesulfobacterium hydrogeniphilum TaxID=161156 RepID=UPI00056F7EC8|nr:sensor domain-containing phosphodiesterase [Thermodesulfobacterium hydrogeniphilum]
MQSSGNISKEEICNLIYKLALEINKIIIITDTQRTILFANEAFYKISNYLKEEIIGQKLDLFIESSKLKNLSILRKNYSFIAKLKKKDGIYTTVELTILLLKNKDSLEAFVFFGKELKSIISHNKEFINLKETLKHVEIYITEFRNNPILFIVLEIRNFFTISSSFGLNVAYKITKILNNQLKKLFPEAYISNIRLDQVLIVIFNQNKHYLPGIISSIFDKLLSPININGEEIPISFNLGISTYPEDADNAEDLYEKALLALDLAKNKGENIHFSYSKDIDILIKKEIEKRNEILRALKYEKFLLYVQPIYSSKTFEIESFEILLRLKHNEEIILPKHFIEILENSGLITKVENWIFEKIKLLASKINNIKAIPSINLSAKSFFTPSLIDKLKNLREILKSPFIIELTERLFIEPNVFSILKEIKKLDILIAIDDFGTGYSSLGYLIDFPVDIVKIDMNFIKRMINEPKVMAIVQVIIDLSKKLGIKTLAEGVENEKQLKILQSLNCNYLQGFYFSKPVSIEDFILNYEKYQKK